MTGEYAAMANGDPWLYADLHRLEPHHAAAKTRTDDEQAAIDRAVAGAVGSAALEGHHLDGEDVARLRRVASGETTGDEAVAEVVEGWARSEAARHQEHGCLPDATGCVEAGPAVPDDPAVLRRDLLALMRQRSVAARAKAAERRAGG